jgi:hypothetical protein
MAGLLGDSLEDPRTMALFALAQGLTGNKRLLPGLLQGAQGYGATMAQAKQQEEQRKRGLLQEQMLNLQMEQQRAQMADQAAQRQQRASDADILRGAFAPLPGPQMEGTPGVAPRFDVGALLGRGLSMDGVDEAVKLNSVLNPKAEKPQIFNLSPGGTLADATGKILAQAPFKPAAPSLPPIAELQNYRDTLPPGDPRRREVDALIANQTRPPKYAGGGTGGGASSPRPAAESTTLAPEQRANLAGQLGVPVAEKDPVPVGLPPVQDAVFRRTLYTNAEKRLNEMDEGAKSAQAMAQDTQRFLELQKGVQMQGPVAGRVPAFTSDAQEMDAITARITPQMRQPGSGATSDFDAKMFQMATVSRTKNDDANEAIAQGVKANAQVAQDRVQFMRDYLSVNGHLDGAERKWKQYADKNPIFDPASPSVPKINPKRVPYQQFFSGASPDKPARTIVRTGVYKDRKVAEYSDGTTDYVD